MRRIALLAVAALAVLAGCSSGGVGSDEAAIVNGEPVLLVDVQAHLEYQRTAAQEQAAQTGQPEPDEDELNRRVVEGLIQQQIIRDGAEAEGVSVTDEDVDARLEDLRGQAEARGQTLEEAMEQVGLTDAILREQLTNSIFVERVAEQLVPGRTDEELEQDLSERPEEVALVDARHVLTEDEATATQARDELEANGDWAAVASEYSTDPGSKDSGGDLGTVRRGQMVPEFEEAVFQLAQEGECAEAPGDCDSPLSEPVQSQFGWHVIQVTSVRLPSLDELREEENNGPELQQERQQALSDWFDELAASAEVEVSSRFGEWDPEEGALVGRDTAPQEPTETPAPEPAPEEPEPTPPS